MPGVLSWLSWFGFVWGFVQVAEADGNRTRQTELLDLTGFEDREDHQEPKRLQATT